MHMARYSQNLQFIVALLKFDWFINKLYYWSISTLSSYLLQIESFTICFDALTLYLSIFLMRGGLNNFQISIDGFLTSAVLSLLLLVFEQVCPSSCSCSSLFLRSSICSLQYAFCSRKCWFCSSSSLSLFVTQSLIRAAFASTCLASERRCWRWKLKTFSLSYNGKR